MKFCPACGSATSGPDQKWCGSCGADLKPALVGATPPFELEAAAAITEQIPSAAPDQTHGAPADTSALGGKPISHSLLQPRLIAGVVVGLILLVGVGMFALRLFFPAGGASSPERAVTEMVAALTNQDPVGALRLVNPGEVDGFDDVFSSAEKRLDKAGLSDGSRLSDAFTIKVSNLEVESDELADNAARVFVDKGVLEISYDPSKLSKRVRSVVSQAGKPKSWKFDLGSMMKDTGLGDLKGSGDEPFVTVVKTDGRWYVSPIATVGEYTSEYEGIPGGDFATLDDDSKSTSKGADNPENALTNLLKAVASQDFEAVADTLPAEQQKIVRAYASLLDGLMTQESLSYSLDVGNVRTRTEVHGDSAKIALNHVQLEFSGSADGGSGSGSGSGSGTLSGTCLDTSWDGNGCLGRRFSQLTGIDSLYVMARKGENGWQIDPIATIASYAKQLLDNVPDDVAFRAINAPALIEPQIALKSGNETNVKLGESGAAVLAVDAKKGQVLTLHTSDKNLDGLHYSGRANELFDGPNYTGLSNGNASLVSVDGPQQLVLMDQENWKSRDVKVTVSAITPIEADPEDQINKGEAHRITANGSYTVPEGLVLCSVEEGYCSDYWDGSLSGRYIEISSKDGLKLERVKTGFEDGTTTHTGNISGDDTISVSFNAVEGRPITVTATPNDDFDISVAMDSEGIGSDSELSGGTERFTFDPTSTGPYVLSVHAFSSGGSFTLSLDGN